ncbi:MAG: AAA family ATPase [Oscillospiraceae bacterium]|nr:AAA family ATPase [Oscillospiraceae bacterium]
MEYGCIGKKLPHSFSKIIHEKIGDYSYELCELTEEELPLFMTKRDFKAINVTIPYKEAVIPYLYELSETAKSIGAVNTVVNRGGKLYGYNTDFYGMAALIKKNNIDFAGKKVAVLGTGGTSKTAAAVAKSLGAETVIKVSRKSIDGTVTYDELYKNHSDTDIIINTTPVGMFPQIYASPVDLSSFEHLTGVIDAVYNPLETKLVANAKVKGIPAESGLYMLVAQAIRAYEIFMDQTAEENLLNSIFNDVKSQKQNIVLIGMPGSGKTTIGQAVSNKLSRDFVDSDNEIKKIIKTDISDYFEKFGEEKFRDVETEVIKDISKLSGAVIATGGGAVLRQENVDALKMNGVLYFLDRPLEQIIPTSDRPTASSTEALKKRYNERYGIYCASADKNITVTGNVQDAVVQIEGEHFNYENSCY